MYMIRFFVFLHNVRRNRSRMSATAYLNEVVGSLLSQGIAATVASRPEDSVEYLAVWLLRHVEADKQRAQHVKARQQQRDQEMRKAAQDSEYQQEQQAKAATHTAAIQALGAMVGDPQDLWQAAVQLAASYTSASAVYVATIVEDEQPGWTPPVPDDPEADVETDDEVQPAHDEAPDEATEDSQQAGAESTGADELGHSSSRPPDYSNKLLRYVAASPGQEFMTTVELRRPKLEGEPGDMEQTPALVPATFRLLDERLPMLEVPAVAAEPRITYLKGFPKFGGYCAVAVPAGAAGSSSGCFQAILAADSLLPDGHGQALSAEDVALLWDIAQALGKALDGAAAIKKVEASRGGGAEVVLGLRSGLQSIRTAAAALVPVPEVGEEPAQPESEQLSPSEAAQLAEVTLQHAEQVVAAKKATMDNAAAALTAEQEALALIVQTITGVRGVALRALKLCTSSPAATFHVLRAALLLLGQEPAALTTWREASKHLNTGLFEQISSYDAAQERDAARWKLVRHAYKAVQDQKQLEMEFPQCCIGALLLSWIKQVRAVARKAAALREAKTLLEAAEAAMTRTSEQLGKAKEAQAKAEEAERAAAAEQQAEDEAVEADNEA